MKHAARLDANSRTIKPLILPLDLHLVLPTTADEHPFNQCTRVKHLLHLFHIVNKSSDLAEIVV